MVGKNKFLLFTTILLVFSFLFSINFVSASHIVNFSSGSLSMTVNEDVTNFFNITINNSDLGPAANITEVNITLWGNFNFNLNTNDTDAKSVFSNTSTVLNWRNNTYVINGSARKYFWFNATATTPGTYNITITTVNGTAVYRNNLSITVNDTIASTITLIDPADSTSATTTAYNFTFNVTDQSTISNCSLIFDGSVINVLTGINNTGGTMGMYNSSLSVAAHTWSVNCTDSFNNQANSSSRTLTISAPAATTTPTSGGGGVAPEWTSTKVLSYTEFSSGVIKELKTRERVKVEVGSASHYIGVKELTEMSVKIEVSSTPQTATLNVGEEKKFDVNGDGSYDVIVGLRSIIINEASLYIKSIDEKIIKEIAPPVEATTTPETTTAQPTETLAETSGTSWGLWIIVIVIAIAIIIVVIILVINQRKKNFYVVYKRRK
ncbi:MAG: hypothetical protein PHF67_05055 [Candidatus Nanoarchaeia archaeon]|nr:hypothetical protein [Candidatus Nanoarchaeia archaeon]